MDKEYFGHFETDRPQSQAVASEEALKFVRRLPQKFVDMQIDAIKRAMDGDSHSLYKFRKFCLLGSPKLDGIDFYDKDILVRGDKKMRIRIYSRNTKYTASSDSQKEEFIFSDKRPAIIYFHGGGWCINGIESCMRICQDYALRTGAVVVACDYSLSPEYPYPAANYNCFDCYKWVYDNASNLGIDTGKIFLSGDSAGGGLALSTALMSMESSNKLDAENFNRLAGLLLFYPAVDVENLHRPSYDFFGKGFCLDSDLMRIFARAYASEKIAGDIYASPINADFSNFGIPVLILASECDILHDEAAELSNKLRRAGVATRYVCLKSSTHIYITRAGMDNAYSVALSEACRFIGYVMKDMLL